MKKILSLCLAFLICFLVCVKVQAQTQITPEKKQLIGELLLLTKVDKQIAEITDTMLKSMETTYPSILNQIVGSRTDLTAEDRENFNKQANKSFQSFSKKFRERLPQAVDYPQYIEEAFYPLYDNVFTEKELSDLVAFYKTETGRKIVEKMPLLFAESIRVSQEKLLPKMMKLVNEIVLEEAKKVSSPPPAPRRQ